jgi:hypothetical protein
MGRMRLREVKAVKGGCRDSLTSEVEAVTGGEGGEGW